MATIHPTAIVSPEAHLDTDVVVGPYALIEGPVRIGARTRVGSFVHIQGHTTIGADCRIFTGACVGSIPQDLKYANEQTYLIIGDRTTIREYSTLNPGTAAGEATTIGSDNLLMAYVHVAHNCVIGSHVIIANNGSLAGHVTLEDYVVIGGMTGIHQFCRIGTHAIVGGCSKVTMDIVPYTTADGHPARPRGLNRIGLRRRGFSPQQIASIEEAYRILFRSGLNTSDAVRKIAQLPPSPEIRSILAFVAASKRGIARERSGGGDEGA